MSTHALGDDDLMHAREEFRDENSVIFRVNELKQEARRPAVTPAKPVPRVTRVSEPVPTVQPPIAVPRSIPPVAAPSVPRTVKPTRPAKPRLPEEETREMEHAPPNPHQEESGLLAAEPPRPWSDHIETDELEGIAERTIVSPPPMASFMDSSADDGIDATLITQPPQHDTDVHEAEPELEPDDDDDGPTLARSGFGPPKRTPTKPVAPPPALSANIHSPAVSELRKPRPSRRTPPGGTPTQSSVLQAIVGAQTNEPMPAPRAHAPTQPQPVQQPVMPLPAPQPQALPYPGFPTGTSAMNGAGYSNDASGLPLGVPTPPSGLPTHPSQYPPYQYPSYPPAQGYPTYSEHHMTPGALYQMHSPYGAPPPNPMTLTGQLRLSEGDEIPAQYRLGSSKRWFVYILAGTFAVTVAATVTFFVIRSMRDTPTATTASIHVDSTPTGATVYYDGQKLSEKTPMKIDEVPVSTKHQIRLELDHYRPVTQDADVSSSGSEVRVLALLDRIKGKIRFDSQPNGAEIRLNDHLRGHTPATLSDIDMESAKTIELRLKDYQPYIQQLDWPTTGEITISKKLERSK